MDNLRRFFLTASVIIFFTLCIGGFISALNYDPKEVQLEPGNPTPLPAVGEIYNPDKFKLEDLYKDNVLFILTSKSDNSAVDFMVTNYNPTNQNLSILIIPDDTKVVDHKNKNEILTLGDFYKKHKAKGVSEYLTSLLETGIGGYCTLTYKDLTSFIKEFGSFKCNLPYGIKYISSEAENNSYSTGINYSKGEVSLNGDSAVNLIKFIEDDYSYLDGTIVEYYDKKYSNVDSKEIHSLMSDDFVYILMKGFVNKINADHQGTINEAFEKFTELNDSKITKEMLSGMTYKLGEIDKKSVKYYRLDGSLQNNNKLYFVYENKISEYNSGKSFSSEEIISKNFS